MASNLLACENAVLQIELTEKLLFNFLLFWDRGGGLEEIYFEFCAKRILGI